MSNTVSTTVFATIIATFALLSFSQPVNAWNLRGFNFNVTATKQLKSSGNTCIVYCDWPRVCEDHTCVCKPYHSNHRGDCAFDCTAYPANANTSDPNSGCKNNGVCDTRSTACKCAEGFEGNDCSDIAGTLAHKLFVGWVIGIIVLTTLGCMLMYKYNERVTCSYVMLGLLCIITWPVVAAGCVIVCGCILIFRRLCDDNRGYTAI